MGLNPQQLIIDLVKLAAGKPVCVAYSGGVDSHVLLHLLAQAKPQLSALRAIHINHGLHADADEWSRHCADKAAELGVAFESIKVEVEQIAELGLEAAARKARYQALHDALTTSEKLLTAQHQQDQAETLMLQLLRGAGPSGLAAMRAETDIDGMIVLRPLLGVSKESILKYAELHQLDWIDDPSNADTSISRNYLRHEVWPLLEKRWPAVSRTLSRSASHCEEAADLLQELAQQDAVAVQDAEVQTLSVPALLNLSAARQRNLLRYLIEKQGLLIPSTVVLQRIIDEVCLAGEDKNPLVSWEGAEVRRFRNRLYIQPLQRREPKPVEIQVKGTGSVEIDAGGMLKWQLMSGQGLRESIVNGGMTLRFRQGGERIRLQGQTQHKSLKQLFQEWQVPPWQRQQIPLLFVGHELVAVVGYGYAEGYAVHIGEKGWQPCLTG